MCPLLFRFLPLVAHISWRIISLLRNNTLIYNYCNICIAHSHPNSNLISLTIRYRVLFLFSQATAAVQARQWLYKTYSLLIHILSIWMIESTNPLQRYVRSSLTELNNATHASYNQLFKITHKRLITLFV
jgi:hypothetical protein